MEKMQELSKKEIYACSSCKAIWNKFQFTPGCSECDGSAMYKFETTPFSPHSMTADVLVNLSETPIKYQIRTNPFVAGMWCFFGGC